MPRVLGIDPGTISVDVCGLHDGAVFLEQSFPTSDVVGPDSPLLALIEQAAPIDLIAGPSGYGLPLVAARDLTDTDLRLACLAAEGEAGGIGGLRSLMRALARLAPPVMLTPGVIHLPTVPAHRKVNRIDLGTADKVCAAALAVHDHLARWGGSLDECRFVLLELGGAFSAALAVDSGRIVDGAGGSAGPMGLRAAGALDGEVAFLARTITKDLLFRGGAASVAGVTDADAAALSADRTPRGQLAWEAYLESAVKAVMSMRVAVSHPREILLSGRVAHLAGLGAGIERRLEAIDCQIPVRTLTGFGRASKQAAQGAALIADGLAGGASAPIVDRLGIRDASGTVLDHLYVIAPAEARHRLGIGGPKPS